MAIQIKGNERAYLRLLSTGLMLAVSTGKINLLMRNYNSIAKEIMEDEEAYELVEEYFDSSFDELRLSAEESSFTAKEAEIALKKIGDLLNERERD